jgi:hypothetical protein
LPSRAATAPAGEGRITLHRIEHDHRTASPELRPGDAQLQNPGRVGFGTDPLATERAETHIHRSRPARRRGPRARRSGR